MRTSRHGDRVPGPVDRGGHRIRWSGRVISTVWALQAPDGDRVSTPVWPSNTDQTTDACPALLSATSEVPIGLYLLDPAPGARKTGAEKPPVTVPERAQRLLRPPLKVMIAPPLELTARLRLCAGPSVPSSDSVVAGRTAAASLENRVGGITGAHDPAGDDVAGAVHAEHSRRWSGQVGAEGDRRAPTAACRMHGGLQHGGAGRARQVSPQRDRLAGRGDRHARCCDRILARCRPGPGPRRQVAVRAGAHEDVRAGVGGCKVRRPPWPRLVDRAASWAARRRQTDRRRPRRGQVGSAGEIPNAARPASAVRAPVRSTFVAGVGD